MSGGNQMNAIERIDKALEQWAQNLRGGQPQAQHQGLQPKDVLHRVLAALEDNRVEGLDHKTYAPNHYTVQLNFDDEERQRLLPFLGREELEGAVHRYCEEHKYNLRGPLEMKITSGAAPVSVSHREQNSETLSAEASASESQNAKVYPPEGQTPTKNDLLRQKVQVYCTYDVTDMQAETYQPVTREPITQ
jgi:hypothetical protein